MVRLGTLDPIRIWQTINPKYKLLETKIHRQLPEMPLKRLCVLSKRKVPIKTVINPDVTTEMTEILQRNGIQSACEMTIVLAPWFLIEDLT